MDPITQGALGAAAAQLAFGRKLPREAAILGWLGGMAADLDVFMQVPGDPLSTIIHHRGITHSLAFIPIGAILPMLPFLIRRENRERWRELYMISLLGYATHGLLDACTSYGTMLLLPFSNVRISWDFIGIMDAWFTIPLIAGVLASVRLRRRLPIAIASAWAAFYMAAGAVQHERALEAIARRAAERGHAIEHVRAMPSPMSLVNWRTSYRSDGVIHVDAARTPYFGKVEIIEGGEPPGRTAGGAPRVPAARPRRPARLRGVLLVLRRLHRVADGGGDGANAGGLPVRHQRGGDALVLGLGVPGGPAGEAAAHLVPGPAGDGAAADGPARVAAPARVSPRRCGGAGAGAAAGRGRASTRCGRHGCPR